MFPISVVGGGRAESVNLGKCGELKQKKEKKEKEKKEMRRLACCRRRTKDMSVDFEEHESTLKSLPPSSNPPKEIKSIFQQLCRITPKEIKSIIQQLYRVICI